MSDPPREMDPGLGILKPIGALGLLGAAIGVMGGVLGNAGFGMFCMSGMVGMVVGAFIALITVIIKSPKPRSLFIVCCVLPDEESKELWWLVTADLRENPDAQKRRRCMRGFFSNAPLIFYHGWAHHLQGSFRRARR